MQALHAMRRADRENPSDPECRGRPSSASTQHGRCDRPDSRRIRRGRGRWRRREERLEKRLRLDAAAREQHETELHVPVTRPACPHGLPLLRQTVTAQCTQPGDPVRGTIFVLPLLVAVSSANVVRSPSGLRDAWATAASTRRFPWSCRFLLGNGHGVLRHGEAVPLCPRDLLLIGETGAMTPALLGRPATASAVLARVAFRRAGGCGRTRQRDPGAGHELLRDEQPNEGPSQASCADRGHTSLRPRNRLQSVGPFLVRSLPSRSPVVRIEHPIADLHPVSFILESRLGVKKRRSVNCGCSRS